MIKALQLPNLISQTLVDGTLNGYKTYAAERKQKQGELEVSSSFAWTRGNFIDSKVKVAIDSVEDVSFVHDKAGYAWEYLQFIYDREGHKALLIFKNARAITNNFDGKPANADHENYLYKLALINRPLKDAGQLVGESTDQQLQLELNLDAPQLDRQNFEQVSKTYDRFYIVTYEIDDATKMIKKIALTMPDAQSMTLVEVQDLTSFIATSPFQIDPSELDPIKNEIVPDSHYNDADTFGYEIGTETQQQEKQG